MGWTSSYLSGRPLPRIGGGERGCGAERRQWRMQRGGAPAAVEKNEQASSAKFFSGTARRRGQYAVATFGAHLCAVRICFSRLLREKQYSYPAQLSVKGVCKGESLVPLCPVLLPFAGAKGRPPRRAVLTTPLQKAPRRRQAKRNYVIVRTINPSVSRSADTSPYTGEPLGRCAAEGEMKLA